MKITIRKEEEINSPERWKELAGPKSKVKHWKEGRSAFEFAKFLNLLFH